MQRANACIVWFQLHIMTLQKYFCNVVLLSLRSNSSWYISDLRCRKWYLGQASRSPAMFFIGSANLNLSNPGVLWRLTVRLLLLTNTIVNLRRLLVIKFLYMTPFSVKYVLWRSHFSIQKYIGYLKKKLNNTNTNKQNRTRFGLNNRIYAFASGNKSW